MLAYRILIAGKVQGVSFRYHTQQFAAKLKLLGSVENLSDGRVEIFVCGPDKDVEDLVSWARLGPLGARVDDLKFEEIKEGLPTKPFHIRRGGGQP